GLLPKNAQARVLGGIALLMVVIIALSGKNPPKPPAQPQAPPSTPVDPSQARIQEYRARIEEQTRRFAAEEAQLAHAKEAFGPPVNGQPMGSAPPNATSRPTAAPLGYASAWPEPAAPSPMEGERQKREYQAPFASNIALSYRAPIPVQPQEKLANSEADSKAA